MEKLCDLAIKSAVSSSSNLRLEGCQCLRIDTGEGCLPWRKTEEKLAMAAPWRISRISGAYASVGGELLLVVANVPADEAEIEDGVEKAFVVDDMDPAADNTVAVAAAADNDDDDDDDEVAVEGDSGVRIGDTGGEAVLHIDAAVAGSSP